jgi:UDP-GlcNAc:undecaprenyl-phosphate GlcNAc-1-phosphate transferase
MIAILLITFIIGLALALVLTPAAKWLGNRIGAVDVPLERKIHTTPIPRSGGLAIALSFVLAFIASSFFPASYSYHLYLDSRISVALLGGLVIFCVGFFDDIHRLRPRFKLLFQIIAASLAYYSGLRIEIFAIGTTTFHFSILSYFVTVFWFLLLINAMNLIDGLDGLAAGIAFFACFVMTFLAASRSDYQTAIELAAFAGVLLGFLRYNFNPATIFMGDGGSYFIGYTIASLSIHGSLKSGLATTLLIPLLALGVPIFDTLLSPVRRWLLGSKMFSPDKGHIHHHLLKKGLSSQRAVLLIYGITFLFCIAGIIIVNIHNALAGIFLITLIIVFFIAVRKIGYLEYLAVDKFFGWLRDLSYEAGLDNERRSFLSIQIQIESAKDMDTLWDSFCRALKIIGFDRGELHIYKCADQAIGESDPVEAPSFDGIEKRQEQINVPPCGCGGDDWKNRQENSREIVWLWANDHCRRHEDIQKRDFFRTELPLNIDNSCVHKLILIRHVTTEKIEPHTLRRMGYLRSSLISAMKKIKDSGRKF